MTDSNAIAIVRSTEVVLTIKKAADAAGNMYKHSVAAAKLAAQNPPEGALPEVIAAIMGEYAPELADAGHNVKAIFKDALTLALSPTTAISLESKKDGQVVEIHTTADKAVDMSKHAMREAAKQVREENGMARKAGGGRKPTQPNTAPSQVQDTGNNEDLAFAAFLHNLPVYFKEAEKAKQIVAVLKEMGLKLQQIK
jgi:hypothetical protein